MDVQELPGGATPIAGVSTSIALFVGRTRSGPLEDAVRLTSFADFARVFGEDDTVSDMARYAKLFFLNGGTDGYVLRVAGVRSAAPTAADYDQAYAIADSKIELFNLLVLPPGNGAGATPLEQLWPAASVFCRKRRAFLLMDPPAAWDTAQAAAAGVEALRVGLVRKQAAIYFPRLQVVENGLTVTLGPAGALAGLYSRVDATRGVWKAPAGREADLRGVAGVALRLSDAEIGQINPAGVNAVRLFPDGVVSWGARTMDGADGFASEYKYVPVRRLALFIEESLDRGLKWTASEPNDDKLYGQIRLSVGAFLHDLFRQGAFMGVKPSEAFFVKCDRETTTDEDRNQGLVNIEVGFAPLKPAEFVLLSLQQLAGRVEAA